jgi:acetylglutamate/LysW-gamma-L-alpha-aminoadipate kinase
LRFRICDLGFAILDFVTERSMTDQSPMTNYQSPITVVKLGGTEGVDFSAICADAAELLQNGRRLVFVHGGSAEANALGEALGAPPKFITSPSGYTSRYTDRKTLEIFLMAVNGKVNSLLTEQLQGLGVNAFGLSGLDGRLMVATRKEAVQSVENGRRKIIRDDYTGKIESVNSNLLWALLEMGCLPVIAPVAVSEKGEALNVDADRAAAMVAAALKAETLILLTAVPGLMEKFPDEATLIRRIPQTKLPAALEMAQGRMKKKVLGAEEALQGGVKRVVIADGRVERPISAALAGKGTIIECLEAYE